MRSIDPNISAAINAVLTAVGAILAYVSTEGLPDTVDPKDAHAWQAWSKFALAIGTPLVAAVNAYLHAVSADKPGALAK
jgi:uncharacterized membrane protein